MSEIEKLKYPIGRFVEPKIITNEIVNDWITEIERLPALLERAVRNLNRTQLLTPYRDGGWTLAQVVNHVADSHINAYVRCKLTVTEENPTVKPYDEKAWAETFDGKNTDLTASLAIIKSVHFRWALFLNTLADKDFDRTYYHPENKNNPALKNIVGMYAWHGKHHLAHINSLKERMKW